MRNKREITRLLRVLAETLEDMTIGEYDQLLDGRGRLKFSAFDKKGKERSKGSSKATFEELQTLGDQLRETKTREEARELLRKDPRTPRKDNLEQLARLLKVHVNKHDTRATVEDKIVESVIGVKLRSEAIQGLNLKSSRTSEETT